MQQRPSFTQHFCFAAVTCSIFHRYPEFCRRAHCRSSFTVRRCHFPRNPSLNPNMVKPHGGGVFSCFSFVTSWRHFKRSSFPQIGSNWDFNLLLRHKLTVLYSTASKVTGLTHNPSLTVPVGGSADSCCFVENTASRATNEVFFTSWNQLCVSLISFLLLNLWSHPDFLRLSRVL